MYAGTEAGLSASDAGGASWVRSDAGIRATSVGAVAAHPADPEVLLAGVRNRVHRSTDAGETWTEGPALQNAGRMSIHDLAYAPSNPAVVYAGTSRGVFKSTDGGITWLPTPRDTGSHAPVIVDPVDPGLVHALDENGAVWRSANGGATWQKVVDDGVTQIWGDPVRSGVAFAGTFSRQLLRTADGGTTWQPVGAGLPAGSYIQLVTVDPTRPRTVHAFTETGVFTSRDDTATWTRSGAITPDGIETPMGVISPQDTDTIVAVHDNVLMATNDGGRTWGRVAGSEARIDDVAIDATGRTLYAATDGAGVIARSADVTPPAITISRPTPGEAFPQGDAVAAAFSCADPGGTGVKDCRGPATVDTSAVGERTFTVTATDNTGNEATRTVTYRVVAAAPPAEPPPGGGSPAPLPPALRVPAPTAKLTVRGPRLRVAVTVRLPKAAAGRVARIEYRRGSRWLRAAQVRVPKSGVVRRTVILTRAKIGGPKVRVVRLRIVLPRTATARAATGKVRTVRVPAPARAVSRR